MTRIVGSRNTLLDVSDEDAMEFLHIVQDIVQNTEFQKLKHYRHHMFSTRYQHCLNVAWYSYCMSKRRKLNYVSCTRGALLHDFYLYDSHREKAPIPGRHSVVHPQVALANAKHWFPVDDVMEDCIANHMFPTAPTLPRTREGWIVSRADKYCASLEWSEHYSKILETIFKYSLGPLFQVREN
ncbi:MAG: HD domain-containing protein [Galactobacillus timonensis]|uniref:HD domain-containing protein n=1 Tax=Galactobacillus timonensis TaxID=2041840 RepID=UPI0023F08D75|nr:HD domain-containing protein [Galactobacillus timonensis]MCI6066789.1 HD domain-containing protein [Galactobacillus timonensis]MCI6754550.1 HD domain-containing protein [Galactobacillus timonensis]MDD7086740.1 HD domain-containing protein [Galactobacillus timonensis]MDY5223321.1 HD domain-containing protein [Lachnospiraceae bacterium]